ncbi:MAG: hypothetical protein CME19_21680 [Gemmatimonadetes bacterium]|nr:hypothetical protein [Gemmatimonadota bacterium]
MICDLTHLSEDDWLMNRCVHPVRSHVRAAIRQNLTGVPSALLEGGLLGDKSGIDDEVLRTFSRSGVSYVLAVSGLHVGLVAAGAFLVARATGGGMDVSSVITTLAV